MTEFFELLKKRRSIRNFEDKDVPLVTIREIIKDTVDLEGDNAFGSYTIPIVVGIKGTKIIINALISIAIFLITYIFFKYLRNNYTLMYMSIFLILPLLVLIFKIYSAKEKKDYSFASHMIKFVMIMVTLYTLVVNYYINNIF